MNQISARWAGGLRFVHASGSGHAVVTDGPREAGGEATAPTPMEMILHGLAGCTGIDVISILRKMKEPVTGLEIVVEGDRAEEYPKVFTRIAVHYKLSGDLDPKKVERAVSLSEKKYCSVSLMLAEVVAMETRWEIVTTES